MKSLMCPSNEQSSSCSTKPCLREQAPLSKLFSAMLDGLIAVLGDSKRKRHIQRLLSLTTVLALILQMVPLGLPAPSKVVTSLLDEAPPPLNILAPIAKEVTAPFDALAAPFSSPPPLAYAAPVSATDYITITKSHPTTAYQQWDVGENRVEIDFTYLITITNETGNSIPSLSMRITPTLPTGVPNWNESGGGTGASGWAMVGGDGSPIYYLNVISVATGTSYVGHYFVYLLQPVPDRTVVTDTRTSFLYNGSQYTETYTYTTTIRAPAYGVSITPSQGVTVCTGSLVTYTITVSNVGGAPMNAANPFSVTAELPTNVITHSTDGGISQGNWVSWTYPALTSVGAAVSRTLAVSPTGVWNNGDSIVITATAIANAEVTPTVNTSDTVTVNRLTAEFTTTPGITVSVNSVVTFTDSYPDPTNTTHAWEFGDGVTTTATSPTSVVTHTYSPVGTYVVTQTVSGSCSGDVFTQTIYVIQPELHILKLDAPDPVSAGQQLTYTIYYSNTSQAVATDVVITDTLPANITGGTATPSQEGVIGPGNVITWSVSSLAAGELKSITLVVDVASPLDSGTVLTNTAGITCSASVYTNTGSVTTTVVSTPTLHIIKTDDPDPVNAGDLLTYTIRLTNTGNMTATNVVITDVIPADTQYASSVGGTYIGAQQWVSFTRSSLGLNTPVSFTFVVTVNTPLDNGTIITNSDFMVTSAQTSTLGTAITVEVSSVPILEILKVSDPTPPATLSPGDQLTYTIRLSNTGNMTATNLVITDVIPADTQYASSVGGTYIGAQQWVSFTRSSLGLNTPVSFTFVVTVNTPLDNGTIITNSDFMVTSAQTSTLGSPITIAVSSAPILEILKVSDPTSPATLSPGDQLTYTIWVSNTGNMTATNVVITDVIPADTQYASSVGGTYIGAQQWVSFTRSSLGLNTPVDFTFVVTVNTPLDNGTIITNSDFMVTSAQTSTLGTAITIAVSSAPILEILKVSDPTPPATLSPGDQLTYTIWVSNTGNVTATNVVITDVIPTYTQWFSGGTYIGAQQWVSFTRSSLGLNTPVSFTFVVTVNTPLDNGTIITNSDFMVTSAQTSTLGSPITIAVSSAPVLNILKTESDDPVDAGAMLTYTIVYSNSGNMIANGVWITDTFDGNVSFGGSNPEPDGGSGNDRGWYTDTLSPSDNYTIVITVTVNGSTPDGTVLTNTADINCSEGVTDTIAPVTTTVRSTDLVITKAVTPTIPLQPGDWLTYTLTFANQGQVVATGVVITDIYQPVSLTNVISISSGVMLTPTSGTPPYTWEVEDLSYGQGGVITITAQVTPSTWAWSTILTNTAYITTTQLDGDGTNDSDWVTSTIQTADVVVSKSIQPATVVSSDTITYTLVYTNAGAAAAQGVCLTDTLPAGVSYGGRVSGALDWPIYTVGLTQVGWCTPTLAGGASGTIVITATVNPTNTASAIFTNTVQITTTTPESDAGNNTYQASNRLSQMADVTITKAVTPTTTLHPNDWITYTLTFSNVGYATATGVVITDIYQPVSLTNVISISSGVMLTPTSGTPPYTWDVQDLSPGDNGIITITAQVDTQPWSAMPTTVTNTAFITTTTPDGDTSNDSDQVTSAVVPGPPANVSVAVSQVEPPICGTVLLTITVTDAWNNPMSGEGVELATWLPSPAGCGTVAPAPVTTTNGVATSTLTAITTCNTSVLARVDDWYGGWETGWSAAVDFGPDIALSAISVTANPSTLWANGSSTSVVTATVTGCAGPTSGVVVTFTISPLGTFPTTPYIATTNASGIATGTLTAPLTPCLATVTATADSLVATTLVTFTAVPMGGNVYLPIVMRNFDGTTPPSPTGDLIVTNIAFDPSPPVVGQTYHVSVTIQNTGTLAVTSDFWVDLYLNPDTSTGHPVPPTVNHRWDQYCPGGSWDPGEGCYGAAWQVTTDLAPGATLDLHTSQADEAYSDWPPPTYSSSHSPFYAQVDSWGFWYGAVYETNETNNTYGPQVAGAASAPMLAVSSNVPSPGSRPSGSWEPRPTLPPRSEPAPTITPTLTLTLPTATPSPPTPTPTPSSTPVPTATPSAAPGPGMTDTPTATLSPVPSPTATAPPEATDTPTPAATPEPMSSPTTVPTATSSATPESGMTDTPTLAVTPVPTPVPTA